LGETSAIPVVVLSRQQDPVEIINSTLRNAGQAVHCTWVRDLTDLADALAQPHAPQLLFLCVADAGELESAMAQRARLASHVPALVVRESLTEEDLVRGLELGAQDVVTLAARGRLQAVAARELNAARLDHALNGTLASARQYRDQMRAFMTGSTDAIAHVQEGIVVDVNPAWSELFGHADTSALLGQPLMDLFDARSHAALKGALVAAAQGRWSDHALSAMASQPDGASLPLELTLERFEFDGEPAVRLRVATQQRDLETLAQQLEEALRLIWRRTAWSTSSASTVRSWPRKPSTPSRVACTSNCNRGTWRAASRRTASRCCSNAAMRATRKPGSRACSSESPRNRCWPTTRQSR